MSNETKTTMMSIKEVAAKYALSEVYVRRAISKGELSTTLQPIAPDSKVVKHLISVEDVEAWREKSGARSRRDDNRNKFVVYMNAEEAEKVFALLSNEVPDVAELITRANPSKKK